jgi:hypothetical protein
LEEDETLDPMAIRLLGSRAVMAEAQRLTHAIEQFGLPPERRRGRLRGARRSLR